VSYVIVTGPAEHRGACVVLRGAHDDVRAAKRILRYALYVARSLRSQAAFLFDAGLGWPPPLHPTPDIDAATSAATSLRPSLPLPRSLLRLLPPEGPLSAGQAAALLRWHCAPHSSPRLCASRALRYWLGSADPPLSVGTGAVADVAAVVVPRDAPAPAAVPAAVAAALAATDANPLALAALSESITVATYSLAASSSSEGGSAQCGARPRLRSIRFCSPSDRTLGQFLEERCLDERITCRACHRGATAHTLTYVHGPARLDIVVVRASQATVAALQQQANAVPVGAVPVGAAPSVDGAPAHLATEPATTPGAADAGATRVALPEDLVRKNLLVEVTAGGIVRSQPSTSTGMAVRVVEPYGQVAVTRVADGKPLTKAYVKVYARSDDGHVAFHKDGFTDLRGRFDYASLSTDDALRAKRFAILVISPEDGAVIREADAPGR
jgi:hypothetical protein